MLMLRDAAAPASRAALRWSWGSIGHFPQIDAGRAFLGMHKEHQVFAELAERSEAFANQQQGVAVFLRRARTHQRDLDLSGHGGDRCAELVRGVGREAAVGLECAVQTIENLIERPSSRRLRPGAPADRASPRNRPARFGRPAGRCR